MSPSGPPNPFESIPPELLRSNTPTPVPSPDASSTALTPPTPTFPTTDSPLLYTSQLPDQASSSPPSRAPSRSFSSAFVSSPLNPNSPTATPYAFSRPRPTSRGSVHLNRIASEESQALGSQLASSQRGSMILYRLATVDDHGVLLPPNTLSPDQRDSVFSTSGESIWSLSSDSKYPAGPPTMRGGLVPYVYDPSIEDQATDEEDLLHEPDSIDKPSSPFASRGILNIGVLVILIGTLLALFIAYPVITYVHGNNAQNLFLDETGGNTVTNTTSADFAIPDLIDPDTPDSVKTRTGFDSEEYLLVFSDEFNTDGRSFSPGVDAHWEAADLSDGDFVYYAPNQVYTANGSLHIRLENVTTNGMDFRSGMIQSWNKFCFTSGYIEVAVTLPGHDQNAIGYSPGVRTIGNLGRPGYGATLDGTWPYTYDSCDVGTFPNQTDRNGLGPAAALHSNASQAEYDYRLSYLPGQRLSACTCPGEDHPGPDVTTGRGAPEIDILEAEGGGMVSQSALVAPFAHDYVYLNDTEQEWYVYNPNNSRPNSYKGSPQAQAISGITQLPGDIFQGSGQVFHSFGLEYFANPANRSGGYIIWQMDDAPTVRMGASSVSPDQGPTGTGVGQRLIPEEPMSIVFNLGVSPSSDLSTLMFPTEMLVDYVRVYQRKGSTNVGCNPPDYPTTDYISRHQEAYTNPQLQFWKSGPTGANNTFPKNSLYNGGC